MSNAVQILVDADACPVKEEIYKVAYRTSTPVLLIANAPLRLPGHPLVTQEIVADGFDAADDRIAELANPLSIVVTADILLADRCLKAGAAVIKPNGEEFTANSIGAKIATRAIMADLRVDAIGATAGLGGPKPFSKRDRSAFLVTLDRVIMKKILSR